MINIYNKYGASVKQKIVIKLSMLFCSLLLATSGQARIKPSALNQVFSYFKPGQEFYSPALGQIAIESGLIENMRFFGNIKPAYEVFGQGERRRSYKGDEGRDSISRLVVRLFPSNGGALTVVSRAQGNFGQYVKSPKTIALLLNHAAFCRKSLGDCSSFEATKSLQERIIMSTGKLHKNAKNTLDQIIESIPWAIAEEKNAGYPAHITELVFLAFFFELFDDQEAVFSLLNELHPSIVDQAKLKAYGRPQLPSDTDFKAMYLKLMAKNVQDFTLDDIMTLYNSVMAFNPLPYKPGVSLLSNAEAFAYDRRRGMQLTQTFADCVEMTERHVMNLLTYNPSTRNFDLSHLNKKLAGKVLDSHPYNNFQRFYQRQKPEDANSGDPIIRSLWNEVVGDLTLGQANNEIHYCQHEGQSSYELEAGYINFVNVFAKIFDIELSSLPINWDLPTAKLWLEEALKTIFKTVNPERNYEFNLVGIAAKLLGSNRELSGKIPVEVLDAQENPLFSFDLSMDAGVHGEIDNLRLFADSLEMDLEQVRDKIYAASMRYVAQKSLPVLALLSLSRYSSGNLMHRHYKLLSSNLRDSLAKETFLTVLYKEAAEGQDINESDAVLTMLGNVLDDVLWRDGHVLKRISSLLLKLENFDVFKPVLGKKVRALDLEINDKSANFDCFLNLQSLSIKGKVEEISGLNNLQNLSSLNLNESSVRNIFLTGLNQLKRLTIDNSAIDSIELSDLPELGLLEATGTPKLKRISLTKLDKLSGLGLSNSALENIYLIDLPDLRTIYLSRTPYLTNLSLARLDRLSYIDLIGSGIGRLVLNDLPSLDSINVGHASNLKKLFLIRLAKFKKLNSKNSGVERLVINGLPELKLLNLSDTSSLKELSLKSLAHLETIELRDLQIVNITKVDVPNLSAPETASIHLPKKD